MLLILALLLFAPGAPGTSTERMRVADLQVLDGFSASPELPQAMLWHNDQLYILDGDARLWLIGAQGRPSSPNSTLALASVRGLYAIDALIVAVDQNGYRRSAYDALGALQGSTMLREPAIYSDLNNQVQAVDPSGEGRAITLQWTHQDSPRQLQLVAAERNDRVHPDSIVALALGQRLLLVNASGRRATYYYALLDLASGKTLATGSLPQAAVGPADGLPEQPVALLVGSSASPERGFVLTEAATRDGARTLHALAPQSDTWHSLTVIQPAGRELFFFQPLDGDNWLATDGTHLLRFRLVPQ